MTSSDRGDPSFDPKTWGSAPRARPPAKPALRSGKRAAPVVAVAVVALVAAGGAGALLLPPKSSTPSAAPTGREGFRRSLAISAADQLSTALIAEGVEATLAGQVQRSAMSALDGPPSDLRVVLNLGKGRPAVFQSVVVRRQDGSGVQVTPGDGGALLAEPLASDLKTQIKVVRGEMDANSFYTSAVAAGVVDSLIPEFAAALAYDFDFQREIRPGDIFEAAFEQRVDGTGRTMGEDRLVYVSLQTPAKSKSLYLFRPPGRADASWFDGNGVSIVRGLMRTPVEGARITSSFGPRMHPVLGYTRVHKGTDFAVPIGTTVYASGDGVVDFVGPHGGHGNFVRIRHNATLETGYAHLSGYGVGVSVGQAVRQGQPIAISGNTGVSSGPHLHYEVIVSDVQVDPMTFQTANAPTLQGRELVAFRQERDRIDTLRATQNR